MRSIIGIIVQNNPVNWIDSFGLCKCDEKPPKNWPVIMDKATTGGLEGAAAGSGLVAGFVDYLTTLVTGLVTGVGGAVLGGVNEYLDQDSIPRDKKRRIPGKPPVNENCNEHNGNNNRDDPRYDLYNYGVPPEK